MKKKAMSSHEIQMSLFQRYPELDVCRNDFENAYHLLNDCYRKQGKVLFAGNGGSAADSEHIVAELMKSFLFSRKIDDRAENVMEEQFGNAGKEISAKLEGALPAIPLTSLSALTSAISNDVNSEMVFSQMVYGYGKPGDVFFGISTSGNSPNIVNAMMVAKATGIATIALTGKTGGKCKTLADVTICVPQSETFQIQELHLPIYHALCAMLEADFFQEK